MFGDAAQEFAEVGKLTERRRRGKRVCQMKMTQKIGEPVRIVEMVGQTAEAVTLLAVDEVEPGKLAAESGLAIVLQSANHGNEVNALDSLREPRYSHVMSITGIARYTKGPTAGSIGPARRPS